MNKLRTRGSRAISFSMKMPIRKQPQADKIKLFSNRVENNLKIDKQKRFASIKFHKNSAMESIVQVNFGAINDE